MKSDPLQLPLRDIHLPEAVSWWPPAPGWWLTAGLLVLAAIAGFACRRRVPKGPVKRLALAELGELEIDYRRHGDDALLLRQLSVLLRRVALTQAPRQQIAALTGPAWLQFLETTLHDGRFTTGAGQVLMDAPYRQTVDIDGDALLVLCRDWITALPKRSTATLPL